MKKIQRADVRTALVASLRLRTFRKAGSVHAGPSVSSSVSSTAQHSTALDHATLDNAMFDA